MSGRVLTSGLESNFLGAFFVCLFACFFKVKVFSPLIAHRKRS